MSRSSHLEPFPGIVNSCDVRWGALRFWQTLQVATPHLFPRGNIAPGSLQVWLWDSACCREDDSRALNLKGPSTYIFSFLERCLLKRV